MLTPKRQAALQCGAVLVLVLWLVVALSLTVLAATRALRGHVAWVQSDLQRLRAQRVLDGALQTVATQLRAQPDMGARYARVRLRWDGMMVDVEIVPARGLIDPNVASDEVLRALFERGAGLDAGAAQAMAARVRDWIDPDDQPSGVGGAEAAQYRAAGWPTGPRNEGLQDPAELLGVLGMTPAIYAKIEPFVGINGRQRPDIAAAPPALIDLLTGSAGLGERIVSADPAAQEAAWAGALGGGLLERAGGEAERVWRLTASWSDDGAGVWRRTIWIDRNPRPDTLTPWTTMIVRPVQRVPAEQP